NATLTGTTLRSWTTISGALVTANTLASSGSLVWEGTATGANMIVSGQFSGVGLTDCDDGTNSKLLWDTTTKRFSCGTDQGGGGGISYAQAEGMFVNQGGDTMTGALTISVTNGTLNTLGMKIVNTLSGAIIHAEKQLTSSGIVVIKQSSLMGSGALVVVQKTKNGTGVYIGTTQSGAPLLALDSQVMKRSGSASAAIAFGYRGNFDTFLYHSNTGSITLETSYSTGTLLTLRVHTGGVASGLPAAVSLNVFKIVADSGADGYENTLFRVTANGYVYSDNAMSGAGADYAEYFYTSDRDLRPGEVVCINIDEEDMVGMTEADKEAPVERCKRSGDPNVMGVISTKPAFIGNKFWGAEGLPVPGTALVGLIGQVPAFAVVESGATIRPGDALTPASIPGYVRRAAAGESTVGVSLQRLDQGTGKINVLISRRNQSLTVEAVEEKVMQSIASMKIEDEMQLSLAKTLNSLDMDGKVKDEVRGQIEEINVAKQVNDALLARLGTGGTIAQVSTPDGGSGIPDELDVGTLRVGRTITASGSVHFLADLTAESITSDTNLTVTKDARIDGDLYLAGALRASALFVPGGLKIDGSTEVAGAMQAASGSVIHGAMNVEGELRAGRLILTQTGSALDIGSLLVRGALRVIGAITIEGLAILSDVQVRGELSVSNRQAGYAAIPKTGTAVTVLFGTGFTATPVVTASPDVPVLFAVSVATKSGFTIRLGGPAAETITFSWLALSTEEPLTTVSLLPASGTGASSSTFSSAGSETSSGVSGEQSSGAVTSSDTSSVGDVSSDTSTSSDAASSDESGVSSDSSGHSEIPPADDASASDISSEAAPEEVPAEEGEAPPPAEDAPAGSGGDSAPSEEVPPPPASDGAPSAEQ
ncbi:hypothetical protein HZA45_00230, partial [Candidatus Peregrinibacteria bacterium]|nr:hypothetical protein [Candidatus Peregrinibacteria bacterium]